MKCSRSASREIIVKKFSMKYPWTYYVASSKHTQSWWQIDVSILSLSCYQNLFFPSKQSSGLSGAMVCHTDQDPLCLGVAPVPYAVERYSSASSLQLPRKSRSFCSAFMEDVSSCVGQQTNPALRLHSLNIYFPVSLSYLNGCEQDKDQQFGNFFSLLLLIAPFIL